MSGIYENNGEELFGDGKETEPADTVDYDELKFALESTGTPHVDRREPVADYVSVVDPSSNPSCHVCGAIMVRTVLDNNKAGWMCLSCNTTTGIEPVAAAPQARYKRGEIDTTAATMPTITQIEPPAAPQRCPTCDSPSPKLHPAVQHEGEVSICKDKFHPTAPADSTPQLSEAKLKELRKAHDMIADIQIEMLKEKYPEHEWHPLFLIRGRLHEWLYSRGNKR
jgi:hypothetical protein